VPTRRRVERARRAAAVLAAVLAAAAGFGPAGAPRAFAQVPGAVARTPEARPPAVRATPPVVLCPYPGDLAVWDLLCADGRSFGFAPALRGLVLPHHFSDQFEIGAVWRSAAAVLDPPLVVVISPDHYLAGGADLTLPDAVRFSTVYGDVAVDRGLAAALAAAAGPAATARRLDDAPFPAEHGVAVHTAFIKRFLPRARLLPILVKARTAPAELDALAADLIRLCPPGTLFVASVDCSHYSPVALSRFHDRMTAAALEGLDGDRLLGAEVDSPEALYLLAAVMRGLGATDARLFYRSDLQDRFAQPIADNTSHLYVSCGLPGGAPAAAAPPVPTLTLLALPAIADPAEAPAGVERAWTWDYRDPDRTARLYPALAALAGAGEEDRRFMGSDLYVCGAGGSAPYRWTVGGVRLALARLELPAPAATTDVWAATLAGLRAEADCIIAVVDLRPAAASSLADAAAAGAADAAAASAARAGADLVIARDPSAAAYNAYRLGSALICRLPGYLVRPDGGDARRDAALLAAVWTPAGWTAEAFALDHRAGRPVLADLPAAKSYDPPPVFVDRE
jgi:AmmeMemoRadiSam system protein B